MDGGWIEIPNWERFQHPDAARSHITPWIKVWTELLSNDDYLQLTPNQRAALHGIWLEYARSRRKLPHNTSVVSRRLALRVTKRTLEALNHAGFIRVSASKPASKLASTEVEEKRITPKSPYRKPVDNRPQPGRVNAPIVPTAESIERQIRNGVITDHVHLEAELLAAGINSDTADHLRQLL